MILPLALLMMLCAAFPHYTLRASQACVPRLVNEDFFFVAGYSVRTKNADEMSGRGRIGPLWQDFRRQELVRRIPNRIDDRLIAVYANYSSDEKGEFTYLLGARVSSVEKLPQGMDYRRITAGRYAVLTTRSGPVVEVLEEEWRRIWAARPSELGGRRAFLTDYEVYDQRSANPNRAQIEIHIGVATD